jgi:hypothetical protein
VELQNQDKDFRQVATGFIIILTGGELWWFFIAQAIPSHQKL